MRKFFQIIFLSYVCSGCLQPNQADWKYLFDGSDLNNWNTYIGPVLSPGTDWSLIRELPAEGLDSDTAGVFSVVDINGERVLRISGQTGGGISTKEEFENYHLQLQFKWGEKKWFPRENGKRDSGLLYHGTGNHGDGDGFWLRSQELQIQEGDCGDYWGVAGAQFDIRARLNQDSAYQYDPGGQLIEFSTNSNAGRHCVKYPDAENKSGEWNTVDLYCFNGESVHMVNGKVVMELENSLITKGDEIVPLTGGHIEIQSEFAEVFYRNIKIRPIEALPDYK